MPGTGFGCLNRYGRCPFRTFWVVCGEGAGLIRSFGVAVLVLYGLRLSDVFTTFPQIWVPVMLLNFCEKEARFLLDS